MRPFCFWLYSVVYRRNLKNEVYILMYFVCLLRSALRGVMVEWHELLGYIADNPGSNLGDWKTTCIFVNGAVNGYLYE